jgi:type I restriction enzyme S subunit
MSSVSGWAPRRLTELAEYINGYAFKPEDWGKDGLPIIRIEQLKNPLASTDFFAGKIPEKLVIQNGDLLFSWSASLFLKIWQHGTAALNQHLFKVVEKEGVDRFFLKAFIEFFLPELTAASHGSTMKHITRKELERFSALFPASLDEQKKIAQILLTVDQAIEQTEALIAKQQRIKTGLMQDLLTRGIDEYGQLRTEQTHAFKDSLLGRIPVEWEVNSLDKLTSEIVDCPHTTPHFLPSGVLVARTFNLKDGQFVGAKSYVSEAEYETRISRLEPHAGDVIFTCEAPVGEAFVVPSEMKICLGQRTMQIRCKQVCLLPEFFVEFVYSEETRIRFDQMVGGTTNPHLNVSDVRALLLRAPSIDEQKRIVEKISAVRGAIQQSLSQKEKLSVLKTALMQDLLTGRKRVTDLLEPIAA